MFQIRYLFFMMAMLMSSILYASEEVSEKIKLIEQKLTSLKLERLQAEIMIKALARSGRLSHNEVVSAKRTIASIKDEDAENILNENVETLKSTKSFAKK